MIIFINNKGTSFFVKLLSVLIDLFIKEKWFRFFCLAAYLLQWTLDNACCYTTVVYNKLTNKCRVTLA